MGRREHRLAISIDSYRLSAIAHFHLSTVGAYVHATVVCSHGSRKDHADLSRVPRQDMSDPCPHWERAGNRSTHVPIPGLLLGSLEPRTVINYCIAYIACVSLAFCVVVPLDMCYQLIDLPYYPLANTRLSWGLQFHPELRHLNHH